MVAVPVPVHINVEFLPGALRDEAVVDELRAASERHTVNTEAVEAWHHRIARTSAVSWREAFPRGLRGKNLRLT